MKRLDYEVLLQTIKNNKQIAINVKKENDFHTLRQFLLSLEFKPIGINQDNISHNIIKPYLIINYEHKSFDLVFTALNYKKFRYKDFLVSTITKKRKSKVRLKKSNSTKKERGKNGKIISYFYYYIGDSYGLSRTQLIINVWNIIQRIDNEQVA